SIFQFRFSIFPILATLLPQRCQLILVERVPHFIRTPAQRHVVFLRPRKIQQRRPEILLLQQPHIHLQPILQRETHLVLAVRQRLIDPRVRQDMLRHRVHHLLPASALGFALSFRLSIFHFRFSIFFIPATFFPQRQQQIQIPHRLLAPPQRSRRCHRFHRLPRLLDVLDNRCCRLFRCADQESSRRLLEHLHRLQNILFALLSKPRQ